MSAERPDEEPTLGDAYIRGFWAGVEHAGGWADPNLPQPRSEQPSRGRLPAPTIPAEFRDEP